MMGTLSRLSDLDRAARRTGDISIATEARVGAGICGSRLGFMAGSLSHNRLM
jgi:hypothetical protein